MTNTITLPRSVVEQALEAFDVCKTEPTGYTPHRRLRNAAITALRAALDQPQVKQGPIWYHKHWAEDNDIFYRPTEAVPDGAVPLYLHPQNLSCKSTQARLATLWGYVKEQPPRRPLTDQQINDHRLALAYDSEDLPDPWDFKQGVRAAERAHGIGGEK